MMTRFDQELSGELGAFWKQHAEEELASVRNDLEAGEIAVDEHGVARNCRGKALMNDMIAKLSHITDRFSIEATRAARDEEVRQSIEEYRKNYTGPSKEELAEMRAVFGKGATVTNILTGEAITL